MKRAKKLKLEIIVGGAIIDFRDSINTLPYKTDSELTEFIAKRLLERTSLTINKE